MQVTYTGIHHDLPEKVQAKVDAKFAKLAKLLDSHGEHKAHVILSQQKRTYRAEVTVHYYDHQFVGLGTSEDLFKAMSAALEKLDAQAVKARTKWRATHRRQPKPTLTPPEEIVPKVFVPQVFKAVAKKKPLMLDEAVRLIGTGTHIIYRCAETENLHILIRRSDGHFDLVES
ncbi:MAG: ribosome-associated translation inhibitor RaiA [Bryobacteraceae bacterium]